MPWPGPAEYLPLTGNIASEYMDPLHRYKWGNRSLPTILPRSLPARSGTTTFVLFFKTYGVLLMEVSRNAYGGLQIITELLSAVMIQKCFADIHRGEIPNIRLHQPRLHRGVTASSKQIKSFIQGYNPDRHNKREGNSIIYIYHLLR